MKAHFRPVETAEPVPKKRANELEAALETFKEVMEVRSPPPPAPLPAWAMAACLQCADAHNSLLNSGEQKDTGSSPDLKACGGMYTLLGAPFISACPHRLVTSPTLALLELKCVSRLPPADATPHDYLVQVGAAELVRMCNCELCLHLPSPLAPPLHAGCRPVGHHQAPHFRP